MHLLPRNSIAGVEAARLRDTAAFQHGKLQMLKLRGEAHGPGPPFKVWEAARDPPDHVSDTPVPSCTVQDSEDGIEKHESGGGYPFDPARCV